ncbi:hypothetical protein [Enterococcus malodoratus]|uniref:Major facilitator superfamily (MFS) profile domain-containing protein n=1 Tax=Enterococcus malodoratus ATCC 43197 TaxID=1158601 RepID=R2QVG2_9ENTE|nr:hypothetical protein [Enterococcus malodoratus]EOH72451.1 hypothetical protein UAI_04036 [Enterococcus malodoratus ATCC 43197]EOT70223.1 hypothetical protein I585_01702 [Enterococcus malodoratus ATCC 43197]OJG66426.1 hypothetical protein RV07_GL000219 [Enterococcus malodoratus]SPW74039.1 Uncharacterised protein [Enterococcus malodoratus]STD65435.1 Uncharacterised protein [Enterococcus malodoratus]
MEAIKNFLRQFTQTTPFVLSNTMIVIPYLLFMHLIDPRMSVTVLPFVLFYTFRVTGIFLIRGLYRSIDQYTLLMVALLVGGIGSFLTLMGTLNFTFYLFGSLFLGVSAAWLPPANTSVNLFEKSKGFQSMSSRRYLVALIVLLPLFFGTMIALPLQAVIVPSIVTLYFVCAYHTVKHYPHYEMDFKELTKHVFSFSELTWFILFFIALFLLRSGRLLFDESMLNGAIILFSGIFMFAVVIVHQVKDRWKLPLWQNALTFLNGMLGNFIFLFGAFYVAVYKGAASQGLYLFLPYLLGVIGSLVLAGKVRRSFKNDLMVQLIGLTVGLLLLSVRVLFPLAIFVLTFFQKGTSSWLNRLYYQTESIDKQQRITAKYSTSNKGSITHQFILMFLMLIALQIKDLPDKDIFLLRSLHTTDILATMDIVKFASIIILLVSIGLIGRIGKHAFDH